jgi:hypothetical protein
LVTFSPRLIVILPVKLVERQIQNLIQFRRFTMFSNSLGTKRWFKQVMMMIAVGFILGLMVVTPVSVEAQTSAEDGLQRGHDATAARYTALAEFYGVQQGLDATAARYTAMAAHYGAVDDGLQRGLQADAARYNALADYYAPLLTMR